MRVSLLTREYPPEVYGGAGVHVEYLARELRSRVELSVHCWGPSRNDPSIHSHQPWSALSRTTPGSDPGPPAVSSTALQALSVDLLMAAESADAEIVHSHTWYTQFGGHLARLIHGVPHVATVHSLEPMRPWKAEQLGGGYALSSFCERVSLESADAVIAVSEDSRRDILSCYPAIDPDRVHVVLNGIDAEEYRPVDGRAALVRHGLDPDRPLVVFVGRITRQKGVPLLLAAAADFAPGVQLALCAGAPDTPEIGAEVAAGVRRLQAQREGVVWIEEMLPKSEVRALLSQATAFACPSIYEPLGIVNLEAMACGTAVVASATGGIVEVVRHGETGFLVPLAQRPGSTDPVDPNGYASAFAQRVNELAGDAQLAARMGRAGRARAKEHFSWSNIAEQTLAVYCAAAGP